MRLRNMDEVHAFLDVVDSCIGDVRLTSIYGDVYNLKSDLSQYIAIANLVSEHGNDLELWCDYKEDEQKFFKFFQDFPKVMLDN